MSDRMYPIPFESLLNWILGEYRAEGSIFGIKKFWRAPEGAGQPFMGYSIESAVGPAAGPHTQMAQNIVTAYLCGARVFELKTVQVIDGEDLRVSKPCILAEDEGYNCEWSTELTVAQARDEYVKAWVLLHVLAKELELGRADGFAFCMSVGYDLAGIQSPKIDGFLDDMQDASQTDIFQHCLAVLERRLGDFQRFTADDLAAVSPAICNNVTISTMHGCPAADIEKIVYHLMENKRLNLLLKCNPTLVGFDVARRVLEKLDYNYLHFERDAFDNDLQYADAVPMLRRIRKKAGELGLFFGVKLTNTFAVKARHGELPDENIYLSGRALLPLSLRVAARLRIEFGNTLPMSYCGGASAKNIVVLRGLGLFPVTVCTELLKPGGYGKLDAMASALEAAKDARTVGKHAMLDNLIQTLCTPARRTPTPHRALLKAGLLTKAARCKACGICVSVCPNRANVVIDVDGSHQLLHMDSLCNECGNCASFCPEKQAPYLQKLTLFKDRAALESSRNAGFAFLPETGRFLLRLEGVCREVDPEDEGFPPEIGRIMIAVRDRYPWLLYR